MLKEVNFELHVQEPYFTQLKDGLKTVEGRCAVGDYMRISSGDFLLFNKCLLLEVQVVINLVSLSILPCEANTIPLVTNHFDEGRTFTVILHSQKC
jgi:hypothetical protein